MPLTRLLALYGYETSEPISERESEGSDTAAHLPDMTLDKVGRLLGWAGGPWTRRGVVRKCGLPTQGLCGQGRPWEGETPGPEQVLVGSEGRGSDCPRSQAEAHPPPFAGSPWGLGRAVLGVS